jgi:predicted Rossmann fold nucleotide-binding protein DprA/Smf involved in DNA uptake
VTAAKVGKRVARVAVVGSRGFRGEAAVRRCVAELPPGTVVVTGGARGVDSWAEDEARRRGVACVVHRADWSTHGRSAGVIRNGVIVADCDRVVAFWDGASRGTADTITRARKAGKSVYVVLEAVVEADGSARGIGDGERR